MAQEARYGRQRSVSTTEDAEDRVLLLSDDEGVSAAAVMRRALAIGLDAIDPQGAVSGYRLPERQARAREIRASLQRAAAARRTYREDLAA